MDEVYQGSSIKALKPASDPKQIHVGMVDTDKLRAFYQKMTEDGRMSSDEASKEISALFGVELTFTPGITNRVTTFEEARDILGKDDVFVGDYVHAGKNISRSVSAFLKLRIICKALNEGAEPSINKDVVFKGRGTTEYNGPDWKHAGKWCSPWFRLYDPDEWDLVTEQTKKDASAVFSTPYRGVFTGLSFCYTDEIEANLTGTGLFLRNKELCEYCAKAFAEIWGEYLTGVECRRYKEKKKVVSEGPAEDTKPGTEDPPAS